jgi:hypothetical protein
MLQHYDIQLDLLIQVPEACEQFMQFLEHCHCPESLMFCLQVKELKRIVDGTTKNKCKEIIDTFLQHGSACEINIDAKARSSVFNNFNSEKISIHIFDDVYGIVYRELQHGQFPRFIRSMVFKSYLAKKGEDFLKLIAYDMRIEGIKDRIMYQPDDFSSTQITDRDIKMMLNMNQDSPDWLMIKDTKDYQVYYSYKQYTIGCDIKFRLCKIAGTLPVSYDKAILAEINPSTRHILDKMTTENIVLDYINYGERDDYPYSNFIVRSGMNYSPFMPRWYYNFVTTVIHDGHRNCYMHIGKSSQAYNNVKKECNQKKHGKMADLLYSYTYYRISEEKTRYIHVFYVAQSKTLPDYICHRIGLNRAKYLHAGMLKVNQVMAKRDYKMDDIQYSLYRTLQDFRAKYETDGNFKTYELSRIDDKC